MTTDRPSTDQSATPAVAATLDTTFTTILDGNAALLDAVARESLTALARELHTARRVFVTGAGRSGLIMQLFAIRLGHLGMGGIERGLASFELGAADEILRAQDLVALEFGRREVPVRLGRGQLGPYRVNRQLEVLGVELRQHVAALDPLPDLRLPAYQLAGNPETQAQFGARPDLAGVLGFGRHRSGLDRHQLDGTHRLRLRLGFGAGRQDDGQQRGQQEGGPGQGDFAHGDPHRRWRTLLMTNGSVI